MRAVFGAMNIGQQVFGEGAVGMLRAFREAGGVEVDAAYVYNDGACEEILGECLERFEPGSFSVATKANPRVTGRLDRESVVMQLEGSLARLGLGSVDVFYLHFPDRSTSLESALEGCADLYERGLFRELGLSNFPLTLAEEAASLCDGLGCPRPTVYEGVYNALSRKAERELLPALDRLGMRFRAYNPLAGGMLTGKYRDFGVEPSEGRFALRAKSYRGRYWKRSYFEAVSLVAEACEGEQIPVAEAALRWLANHSALSEDRGDGVIVGASRLSQLEQNLASLAKGPLPEPVLAAFEAAWGLTERDAPEYYRFYDGGRAV